jgi:hypothetical protein
MNPRTQTAWPVAVIVSQVAWLSTWPWSATSTTPRVDERPVSPGVTAARRCTRPIPRRPECASSRPRRRRVDGPGNRGEHVAREVAREHGSAPRTTYTISPLSAFSPPSRLCSALLHHQRSRMLTIISLSCVEQTSLSRTGKHYSLGEDLLQERVHLSVTD